MKRNQRNKVKEQQARPRSFHIQPKTHNQGLLLDAIEYFPITVTLGAAGVGKTFCAASKVAQLFMSGSYDHIILTRSNVPTGRSLGFFPGDIKEKLAPWLLPMITVLQKQLTQTKYEYLLAKDTIQYQPIETIRGRSFENALILVDEVQNITIEELKAITTRLGENSKMVLMGDASQSDINNGKDILKFYAMCERAGIEIPIVRFTVDDIVRSDIVGKLVKMFIKEKI